MTSATSTVAAHGRSLEAALEQAAVADPQEPRFVSDLRRRGAEGFAGTGFPTPRQEEWRFTNLKRIADTPYRVPSSDPVSAAIDEWCLPAAHRLTVVDGVLAPGLSTTEDLPGGVILTGLADAIQRHPEMVEPYLGRDEPFPAHAFADLNGALFEDGAFLWLPPGATVDGLIQLLFVTTSHPAPVAVFPRTLIVAGAGSAAEVVATHAGAAGDYLSCPVTEIAVEPNANLRHTTLQEEGAAGSQVAVQRLLLGGDASVSAHWVAVGAKLARADVQAVLTGEGADLELGGLYMTGDTQHVDNHLLVRHATPHGTSRQLYKGVLDDRSRAVFNGRIVVDHGAQKTDARQSNRNLLLSDRAMVNSNPQLEIFADDVRCTHGSAIGRLDEDALFYLRSRGLEPAAAESLLTYAFAAEVLERVPSAPARRRAEGFLRSHLAVGSVSPEVS